MSPINRIPERERIGIIPADRIEVACVLDRGAPVRVLIIVRYQGKVIGFPLDAPENAEAIAGALDVARRTVWPHHRDT